MMPVAKHGDPQLGVDVHMCVVPPSPSPVPLPTPHMSVVFDPFDYVPFLGATVTVCGMKRAVAGTSGQVVHIPPGFPFSPTPKLPDKDDEIFMGSATVVADGDPLSFLAVPVLACQMVGMPSPPRPKRKGGPRAMLLPTVVNLAIPTSVFVGGPPTISLLGTAFKLGFAGLGGFAKSRRGLALAERFAEWRKAKWGHLNPGFLKCAVLRAEPVNIVTGAVSVEQEDFTLPGLIPIRWTRRYASDNPRRGACGVGWECPADARLEHDAESGVVLFRHPEGGIAIFPTPPQSEGDAGAVLELMDGALLSDHGAEFRVRTKEDRIYRFPKSLARDTGGEEREYPLGQVEDLCGNTLTYERSPNGRLVAIRESAGRRIEVESGADGLIRQVALHVPESGFWHVYVEYGQDASGDLVEVRDALGNPYRFAYDEHRMLRHTNRNGLSFYYEYDKSGEGWRVVRSWGDGGLYAYKFAYLNAVNERRITDSLGHSSLVKLDERGLPISEIDALGGVTAYEYDDAGRTTAVVDPDRKRTEYEYDVRGNLLRLMQPDGTTTMCEFDASSKPTVVTEANGAKWVQRWDMRGLMLEQVSPLGYVTRSEYDARGRLAVFVSPRGARSEIVSDGVGHLVELRNALGGSSRFVYDAVGNLTACSDSLGRVTQYAYDGNGRLTAIRLPSGAALGCSYDAQGNLTRYSDENGAVTHFEYSGQGEIAYRIQADGHSVRYHYDTEERLIGVTNQRSETYKIKRDPLGRVVEETDFWQQSRTYRYSAGGKIRESTDSLKRTVAYDTDPVGRVLRRTLLNENGSGAHWLESFEYDASGKIVACENPAVRIERCFDAEGRLTEERQGAEFVVRNAYDEDGNRVLRQTEIRCGGVVQGHTTQYRFNLLGEISEIAADGRQIIRMERDQAGHTIVEWLGSASRLEIEYNLAGRPLRQCLYTGARKVADITFRYDAAGNLIERRDAELGVDSFTYDVLGHVTQHINPRGQATQYNIDSSGERLITRVVSRSTPNPSWLREGMYRGIICRFDRAGTLVSLEDECGVLSLLWDADQHLVESRNHGIATWYSYDPLGRRVGKHSEGATISFFWDEDALLAEKKWRDSGGDARDEQALREWIYMPDSFEPLAMVQQNTKRRSIFYYFNDPNGCPTRLVGDSGEVKWLVAYGAWGDMVRLYTKTEDNPIRLQGQYADPETGLFYNRFRYYSPKLGMYISADPLRLDGGTNLYSLGRNVLGWIDPLGLACYVATRNATQGVIKGRKLSEKQALNRIRRGLDVIADSRNEARSLAKRALIGKPMHHGPHGPRPLFLPHWHPNQHANSSHVFYP